MVIVFYLTQFHERQNKKTKTAVREKQMTALFTQVTEINNHRLTKQ